MLPLITKFSRENHARDQKKNLDNNLTLSKNAKAIASMQALCASNTEIDTF